MRPFRPGRETGGPPSKRRGAPEHRVSSNPGEVRLHLMMGVTMSGNSALPGGSGFDIEVFYDGDCPLCMREVRWLRRRTASRPARRGSRWKR